MCQNDSFNPLYSAGIKAATNADYFLSYPQRFSFALLLQMQEGMHQFRSNYFPFTLLSQNRFRG